MSDPRKAGKRSAARDPAPGYPPDPFVNLRDALGEARRVLERAGVDENDPRALGDAARLVHPELAGHDPARLTVEEGLRLEEIGAAATLVGALAAAESRYAALAARLDEEGRAALALLLYGAVSAAYSAGRLHDLALITLPALEGWRYGNERYAANRRGGLKASGMTLEEGIARTAEMQQEASALLARGLGKTAVRVRLSRQYDVSIRQLINLGIPPVKRRKK